MVAQQLDLRDYLSRSADVERSVRHLAGMGVEERGAVFTKRSVATFILDLAGYRASDDLCTQRLLEPSFGGGEFLCIAIDRLFSSYFRMGGDAHHAFQDLHNAIRAVELHSDTYATTRDRIASHLSTLDVTKRDANRLLDAWLLQDDFLLADDLGEFTHVVGNPPYVRQELIPPALIHEYRRRFTTIYDRADLYIPFIEKGLSLLAPEGVLAFICADRWMKNKYGGPLRSFVVSGYHLRYYVDMVGTPAFEGDVSAYPAIFVIARERIGPTIVGSKPDVTDRTLAALAKAMVTHSANNGALVRKIDLGVGDEPWLLDNIDALEVLKELERGFPQLEQTKCHVGIGVATGADKVFIRSEQDLPVEVKRRIPIVTTGDIHDGRISWSGNWLLNPFEADGSLADLITYPRFAAYVEAHRDIIIGRHVARVNPERWYRTIDRVYPDLTATPKLLIPDIKRAATVVYDEGRYYPHHNFYFVTSTAWDLRALQAVLRSVVAEFFVAMYATRMRGGYLRFQAQYIRRIRLPQWASVSSSLRQRLRAAATSDRNACDQAAFELYGLSQQAQSTILSVVYEAKHT